MAISLGNIPNIFRQTHFLHPYLSYLSSLPGFFHPAAPYVWHIPHERGHHHGSWGMTPIGRVMFLSKNGQYIYIYICVLICFNGKYTFKKPKILILMIIMIVVLSVVAGSR